MIKKIVIGLIIAFVLLIFGAIIHSSLQPQPYSWNYSLHPSNKQPYGASVLRSQLAYFFPGKVVRRMQSADLKGYYPYVSDYYNSEKDESDFEDSDTSLALIELRESLVKHFNFIGISPRLEMSTTDVKALWLHVYQGNDALLLANKLSPSLRDNLGISVKDSSVLSTGITDAHFSIQVKNGPFINHKTYRNFTFIDEYPPEAEVIAKNKLGQVLGISLNVGDGKIIYFCQPIIFSNYYLLKGDKSTAASILELLPVEDTYFAQYTRGQHRKTYAKQPSLMSFIHSKKPLSWAFYTLLFSILLFMLFRLKRLQRIIPVVKPPENSSLEYAETLSNLYLMHNNHKEIALKKMNYFLTRIRLEYNLDASSVDDDFYKRLSVKSKVDIDIIKKLFVKYHYISARHTVSVEDFLEFCKLLQHFKN